MLAASSRSAAAYSSSSSSSNSTRRRLTKHLTASGNNIVGAGLIMSSSSSSAAGSGGGLPLMAQKKTAGFSTHVSKIPGRSSIPEDATTNPHHVVKKGTLKGFKNPYPSYQEPNILKYVVWPSIRGKLKSPARNPPNINVIKPDFLTDRFAAQSDNKIRATWLGHACYYVEYPSGLRVLFDPVFEDCCSPFPVSLLFPKRYTKPPCQIKDLPTVDAVVVSHSHYDHLSHPTALEIQQFHPKAQFFVGLGLEKWFRKQGLENVTELDWWEEAELTVKVREAEDRDETAITARVSCLPCQHTSARSPFDKDTTLWCSWAVRSAPTTPASASSTLETASTSTNSNSRSVWFGGDTGYRAVPEVAPGVDDYGEEFAHLPRCPQFKQIGDLRGPFDLGLIPIGAYHPRAAFSGMHANPFDSVEIFRDTACKRAMGIHWGTWALTMEEILEPPKMLKEALRRRGIPEVGVFDTCDIGESREF